MINFFKRLFGIPYAKRCMYKGDNHLIVGKKRQFYKIVDLCDGIPFWIGESEIDIMYL